MDEDASRAREYRAKAEELKSIALQMSTDQAKQTCIELAAEYLWQAERLERSNAEKSDSSAP